MQTVIEQAQVSTATLYDALLQERAQEERFDPREVRLSEIGLCDRRQTLRMLGYEPEQPDARQQSIFQAGEEHEDTIYALWAQRYPRRVRRQVPVRFAYGTGHIDIWVSPLKRIVESKSVKATSRRYLPMAHHTWQVKAYLHLWGRKHDATAEIAYRLKETGEILSFPVTCDEEDASLIEDRILAMVDARDRGTPLPVPPSYRPDRFPCAWEDRITGELVTCPFWKHCWAQNVSRREVEDGRKTREALEVQGHLAELLREMHALRGKLRAIASEKEAVQKALEPLEAALGKAMEEGGVDALIGVGQDRAILATRTRVAGAVTYDLDQAIRNGVVSEAVLAPYRKVGKGYDRWTVREVEYAPEEESPF